MSASSGPTEEELRALEAQLSRLRVDDVLLENAVTLVNIAFRRTGLSPGTEGERDPEQVRLGIDGLSAMMPVLERIAPEQSVAALRDALSQLQLAYVRLQGEPGSPEPGAPDEAPPPEAGAGPAPPAPGGSAGEHGDPAKPGDAGPAQRSGRLWVPGS